MITGSVGGEGSMDAVLLDVWMPEPPLLMG